MIATQNALSAEGAVAAVRGELSVLEAAGIRDERELEAISHRLDVVDGQLRDESTEIATLNEEVRSIDETVVKLQTVFDLATRRRGNGPGSLVQGRGGPDRCPSRRGRRQGQGRSGDSRPGRPFRPGGAAIDRSRAGGDGEPDLSSRHSGRLGAGSRCGPWSLG